MLTKNKMTRFSYVRRLLVLPLLTIVVLVFAFRQKESLATSEMSLNTVLSKKYKIVIDAGHGGQDLGCKSADGAVNEKDINLAIAQAVKQINNNKNIEIVLTRDNDYFDDVIAKAALINNQKVDLCVSIHCSDAGNDQQLNGTEIYVASPKNNKALMNESHSLAQSVNGIMKNDFTNRGIKTSK
jgi:N-acetylmuramoyl-L-alanine amidase